MGLCWFDLLSCHRGALPNTSATLIHFPSLLRSSNSPLLVTGGLAVSLTTRSVHTPYGQRSPSQPPQLPQNACGNFAPYSSGALKRLAYAGHPDPQPPLRVQTVHALQPSASLQAWQHVAGTSGLQPWQPFVPYDLVSSTRMLPPRLRRAALHEASAHASVTLAK